MRLLPEAALDLDLCIELVFTDLDSRYLLSVRNSVLNYFKDANHLKPQVTLTISSLDFKNLLTGATDAAGLLEQKRLEIEGDASRLLSLRGLFDQFVRRYPLVTPEIKASVRSDSSRRCKAPQQQTGCHHDQPNHQAGRIRWWLGQHPVQLG